MTKIPEDYLEALQRGERFLLTGHRNPDGDSIGSGLALVRMLESMGKKALVWNRDPTPSLYLPLPGSENIVTGPTPPKGFPEAFDYSVILECPTLDRTGLEDSLRLLPLLNIDHHLGNDGYGVASWVDSDAPSLGEMLSRLAQALHLRLDAETATCLYLTLVTDTGGFRFSNASSSAFQAAADLVKAGALPEVVAGWLYESRSESAVRLLGEMLSSLQVYGEGAVASAVISEVMFTRAGADASDTEGLVDYPRSIRGVQKVALLRQVGSDCWKISLRSSGTYNVQQVAESYGGGGHRNAAGCLLEGNLDSVRQRIVNDLINLKGGAS